MTKNEEKAKEILYGMGCLLILGFLVIAFVYYMFVIPIVIGIIIIICIITRTKKKGNWKKVPYIPRPEELRRHEPIPVSNTEYSQMCKDLNKTTFTAEEYKEWKNREHPNKIKQKMIGKRASWTICPDCKTELDYPYKKCNSCGWGMGFCPNCKEKLLKENHCDLCGWANEQITEYLKGIGLDPNDPKVKRMVAESLMKYPKGSYYWTKEAEYDRMVSEKMKTERRSRTIPKHVQREVWRRDQGRCVECGSKELLEFDHIIPFSKGGSNTTRNIQLLCEACNRKKTNHI